jgi:hypothetical protein
MTPEMESVILWLQSPEGEAWSAQFHAGSGGTGGNIGRHSSGVFASVKYDHESCTFDENLGTFRDCRPATNGFSYTDNIIKAEIQKWGMNGVPDGRSADQSSA